MKKVMVVKCQNCDKVITKIEVREVGTSLSQAITVVVKAVCPVCKDRPESGLVLV